MAISVVTGKSLPTPYVDGVDRSARGGKYGETFITGIPQNKYGYADEGSYFVAVSVPGTPIVSGASLQAFAETAALVLITNSESASNTTGVNMYLDYIKLICKVTFASATALQYACQLDKTASRYTSGGSAAPTSSVIANVNGNSSATSKAATSLYMGPLVIKASTGSRIVGTGLLCPYIPLIYDQYIITFGNVENAGGGTKTSATAGGVIVSSCAPVIIAPQWNFAFSIWGPSAGATGAQFDIEIGWWER